MTIPPEMIEACARAIAPYMEGGREYDQMPPDRIALRKWSREGMCSFNDATQDDAREAADAASRMLAPMMAERFERIARANQYSPAPYCDTLKAIRALVKEKADG